MKMSVEIWQDGYSDQVNVKNFSDHSILINSSIFIKFIEIESTSKMNEVDWNPLNSFLLTHPTQFYESKLS